MNTRAWNIFHDGDITAISGEVPGDVEFFIEAEYLREQFVDPGKGFKLRIAECTMISFRSYKTNQTVGGINALVGQDLEILSARPEDNNIVLVTTNGELRLTYESERILLDSGRQLELSDLVAASEKALAGH